MKLALVIFAFLAFGFVGSTKAEGTHFFEPTQADYDAHSTEIMAQQAVYKEARDAKDWDKAQANALFHFTKAWLYFNEGMSVGRGDKAGLEKIKALFDKADTELALNTVYPESAGACADLVKRNRLWVEAGLAKFNSK